MDREIAYIYEVLSTAQEPLTASEISKEIFGKYETRISKTITRNYLWSYFREIISYDSSKYTFTLKEDKFLLEDIDVFGTDRTPRALSSEFDGSRIKVVFDTTIPIEIYIKAISLINYKHKSSKKKLDLIKQLNRTIEQLLVSDD